MKYNATFKMCTLIYDYICPQIKQNICHSKAKNTPPKTPPKAKHVWLGILVLFYSNSVSSIHPYSPMIHCVHVFKTLPQQQDYLQLY